MHGTTLTRGSQNSNDCVNRAGFYGPLGGPFLPCQPGTFNEVACVYRDCAKCHSCPVGKKSTAEAKSEDECVAMSVAEMAQAAKDALNTLFA